MRGKQISPRSRALTGAGFGPTAAAFVVSPLLQAGAAQQPVMIAMGYDKGNSCKEMAEQRVFSCPFSFLFFLTDCNTEKRKKKGGGEKIK